MSAERPLPRCQPRLPNNGRSTTCRPRWRGRAPGSARRDQTRPDELRLIARRTVELELAPMPRGALSAALCELSYMVPSPGDAGSSVKHLAVARVHMRVRLWHSRHTAVPRREARPKQPDRAPPPAAKSGKGAAVGDPPGAEAASTWLRRVANRLCASRRHSRHSGQQTGPRANTARLLPSTLPQLAQSLNFACFWAVWWLSSFRWLGPGGSLSTALVQQQAGVVSRQVTAARLASRR